MEPIFMNIKAETIRRGLTIEEVCKGIGIGRRTYYGWRTKGKIPSAYAVKFARFFGIPTDELIGVPPQENIGGGVHTL